MISKIYAPPKLYALAEKATQNAFVLLCTLLICKCV